MTGAAWLVVWLIHLLALFVIAATIIPHEETSDDPFHRPAMRGDGAAPVLRDAR